MRIPFIAILLACATLTGIAPEATALEAGSGRGFGWFLSAGADAGIGGRGLLLRLDDPAGIGIGPDLNDPTLAQVLGDPGKRSDLSTGALALSLGFGVDLLSSGRVRERRGRTVRHGLMVGVRAGYQWTPTRDDWRLHHVRVIGGPDDLGAVRLNVGGGGWAERRAGAGADS